MPRRKKTEADQPQPIDGGGDVPYEQSNSDARGDTIRAAARWLAEREAEVASLREEINSYKQTHIKGALGFKMADWNTLYRLYNLDGDDRDQLLDTIREGFAALGVGGQSSFLDAMDQTVPAAPKANGNGTAAPNPIARETGYTDGFAAVRDHAAKWAAGEYGHGDYELGWTEGQAARVEHMTSISGA
jgi:hypothetical protein